MDGWMEREREREISYNYEKKMKVETNMPRVTHNLLLCLYEACSTETGPSGFITNI